MNHPAQPVWTPAPGARDGDFPVAPQPRAGLFGYTRRARMVHHRFAAVGCRSTGATGIAAVFAFAARMSGGGLILKASECDAGPKEG
jgi:hypothetical protein